ncbi:MAG: hypothetical protein Q9184_004728 [Pyrenodesmia sp. 2 TL-2023]
MNTTTSREGMFVLPARKERVSTHPSPSILMSSSSDITTYTHLISLLSPQPPTILEIEILPSSISQSILYTDHCIGIPKSLLVPCFLRARSILSFHLTTAPDPNRLIATQKEALDATLVILLFDGGHISALNLRKRSLWALRIAALAVHLDDGRTRVEVSKRQELIPAILREFLWVESLITSPLYKHAKSPTLWAHRWWIVKWFWRDVAGAMIQSGEPVDEQVEAGILIGFVEKELQIVMKAGERHSGNYHAWNHAREMVRLVMLFLPTRTEEWYENKTVTKEIGEAWRSWIGALHRWCLGHPRDISGWSFLVFLMDQPMRHAEHGKDAVRDVFQNTENFVKRFEWQGRSVDWFLGSANYLRIDSHG